MIGTLSPEKEMYIYADTDIVHSVSGHPGTPPKPFSTFLKVQPVWSQLAAQMRSSAPALDKMRGDF